MAVKKNAKTIITVMLLAVLLLLAPLFFIGGPDYYSPRSEKLCWNLGHIVFFAAAAYLVTAHVPRRLARGFISGLVTVLVTALLLGLLIELLQYLVGRDFDWVDLYRDVMGALLGFMLAYLPNARRQWRLAAPFAIILLLGLLAEGYGLLMTLLDERSSRGEFPVLAKFESPAELGRWKGSANFSLSDDLVISGSYSLLVELGDEKYSGVSFQYFSADWRGYNKLTFDVYNPDRQPLRLVCRINDYQHVLGEQQYSDRFNQVLVVKPGLNHYSLALDKIAAAPVGRSMDMSSVIGFTIFSAQADIPRRFYLDNIRLQ